MSENLDKLKAAGVVKEDAILSDAEKTVIEGLSEQEVGTLISMRKKLEAEMRKQGGDGDGARGGPELSSNIIV